MGGKQSKLKKELEALKADAAAAAVKHDEETESLRSDKRMLEFKLHALQEMTAKAQIEAETATQLALESEEKMKALKWELVRRLSVPSTGSTPSSPSGLTLTASTSSSSSSLLSSAKISDSTTSAIPRVPINWKLKEGVVLRRSNTSFLPKSKSSQDHDLVKKEMARNIGGQPVDKPVSLTPPRPAPAVKASSQGASGAAGFPSNQDDAPPPSRSTIPVAAAPLLVSAAVSNHDIFAPVKRRTSTMQMTEQDSKSRNDERIESLVMAKHGSDSDSDRDRSSQSSSTASSHDDGRGSVAAEMSRGVRATAKGMSLQQSKTADDALLALSDDEED